MSSGHFRLCRSGLLFPELYPRGVSLYSKGLRLHVPVDDSIERAALLAGLRGRRLGSPVPVERPRAAVWIRGAAQPLLYGEGDVGRHGRRRRRSAHRRVHARQSWTQVLSIFRVA